MWLRLFSNPSARSRLAETVAAAKSSALDELYGRVFACAALERLLKAKLCGAQNPNIFADRAKPSNASMRSPYTKGLAVCQIQGPYEEAESYSVIRRARDIIARNRGPAAIISASASHTCTSDPVELTCQASLRTTTQQ